MEVDRITTISQFDALRFDWNRLAGGVPFQSWEWMRAWWVHFGQQNELFILLVRDDHRNIIGIAPWFVETSLATGRRIRFLGSGKARSDYLSLLCENSDQEAVARTLAKWLIEQASPGSLRKANAWDLLSLSGVEVGDPAVASLKHHLTRLGGTLDERPASNCWRIPIPESWNEYLEARPKSYRRKMRRLKETMLDSGRARWQLANDEPDQAHRFLDVLVDLHERRRASLRQHGCFEHPTFRSFLLDIVNQFCGTEHLYCAALIYEERMAAACIGLVFENVNYVYQCGMSPALASCQPGWMLNISTIQHAIRNQLRGVDFLCGDQPYKAHLGAKPVPMMTVSIAAPRPLAVLRQQMLLGHEGFKKWLGPKLPRVSRRP